MAGLKKILLMLCWVVPFMLNGQSTTTVKEEYQVVFFISPTCKICQYYALYMRELPGHYDTTQFHFLALMPGKLVDDEVAAEYKSKYRIPFEVRPDADETHHKLNATITPEVFVLNSSGEIIYHGRIDDAYFSVGKKRTIIKHHELDDVLHALEKGEKPSTEHVPAVGCLIEKSE